MEPLSPTALSTNPPGCFSVKMGGYEQQAYPCIMEYFVG